MIRIPKHRAPTHPGEMLLEDNYVVFEADSDMYEFSSKLPR